jgi:hypothetical protein
LLTIGRKRGRGAGKGEDVMIVGAKERIVWVLVVLFASTVGYFHG